MAKLHLGVDIGSISINCVVIDPDRAVREERYIWCRGRPFHQVEYTLSDVLQRYAQDEFDVVAFTGSGGLLASQLVGGCFVNEIVAQAVAVLAMYPRARSIIEIGGEDSKLIVLSRYGTGEVKPEAIRSRRVSPCESCPEGSVMSSVEESGPSGGQRLAGIAGGPSLRGLDDFAMNTICAAGTGAFLDQQASRMGLSIEGEFGELALKSEHPPRIAGRCSVFAKSDMIHLQQLATPVCDIVAGLCFAVARNFQSNLARGKEIETPVVFQGGVAANAGMVRAFREQLQLADGNLIIPKHHASMGAIGAVYDLLDRRQRGDSFAAEDPRAFRGLEDLRRYLAGDRGSQQSLAPLRNSAATFVKDASPAVPASTRVRTYLGLDVGSLSTNVVLIDDDDRVIARRYLPTASRPLEAIQRGLREIWEEVGGRVDVCAVGTTGSGRYLTGDFVGSDVIENEITAQATAAIAHDLSVDTIFEIGGQDSKYIRVDHGVVVDFEMNKVCAAGTGSFLEEQAERLGIRIEREFENLAMEAARPCRLGDRCTVFMGSEFQSHQQRGASTENLVAGLAYSIVQNYLQKVVGKKKIGERIFFQGGVANNRAVVAAFEAVTGKDVVVPPHFDVTGAIGAAMLARRRMRLTQSADSPWTTRFKGFEISRLSYTMDRFACSACANQCDIHKVGIEGDAKPLYYGGRCEKWERDDRKGRGQGTVNLFAERLHYLMGDFQDDSPTTPGSVGSPRAAAPSGAGSPTMGIPRAMMVFHQEFPFWRTFFQHLGFRIILSRPTDGELIQRSRERRAAETCFPVETVYGHVVDLIDQGVDYVFLPFVVNAKASQDNATANYHCPWVQTYPFMIQAAFRGEAMACKLLTPTLHFRYFSRVLPKDLIAFAGNTFGFPQGKVREALAFAEQAQAEFERTIRERGRAVLDNLPADQRAAVVLGRTYSTSDPSLNLGLVEKLIQLGIFPIPVDYLPLEQERVLEDYPMMYWPNGQKILAAARIVARDERLTAISLSHFGCGPDSFLAHYVHEELAGKPYLQLEVDEHSADVGMLTRCEAFLDSLKGHRSGLAASRSPEGTATRGEHSSPRVRSPGERFRMRAALNSARTLYYPYMCDAAHALAAASRSCGVDAWVLPVQDETDIELGRRYTSSKECFPMICTLGSFLRKTQEPGFDPQRASFFMPDHGGPCRFGQYNKLQRMILDKLGYEDVEIIAPTNGDSYAGLSGGHGNRFRMTAIKGIVACDLLRKLQQERRPYEADAGETDRVYRDSLKRVVECVERGAKDIARRMRQIAQEFQAIKLRPTPRRPVIAIVGEIFMRDNPPCSGFLVDRLEALGAETLMSPLKDWFIYSTLRYGRDSRWKADWRGGVKSRIQAYFTRRVVRMLSRAVRGAVELERDIEVEEMLERCGPYVHRDYDGEPALALGAASALVSTGISGVANLLPFRCLPGTLVSAVSGSFRDDHESVPWVNIEYDGQQDAGMETRLQAFLHQASEYCSRNGFDRRRNSK